MMKRLLIIGLIPFLVCITAMPAWAAISYVGGQTGSFLGTTTPQVINFALTGGSGATPAAGDLIVASYTVGSAGVDLTLIVKTPSGANYTLFGTEIYASDSAATNLYVGYIVASATPETQIELSESVAGGTGNANYGGSYTIHVFRGIHATPLEQPVQQGTAANTQTVNPGGITPTTAGTWVYVVGGGALATTGAAYTSSDLSAFISSTIGDVYDSQTGAGYLEWSSGAFNPATFGGGGATDAQNSHGWMIVALAPAAAGSTCRGALMMTGIGEC